jgi:hypothetical protein
MEEYRSRMITMMSVMMGMIAASMTLFMAISKSGPFSSILSNSNLLTATFPAIAAMLVVVAAAATMSLMRVQRRHLEERERLKREQTMKSHSDAP